MFENSKGQHIAINLLITNRNIHLTRILDIRTLNSAKVGGENKLAKMQMKLTAKHHLDNKHIT